MIVFFGFFGGECEGENDSLFVYFERARESRGAGEGAERENPKQPSHCQQGTHKLESWTFNRLNHPGALRK